MSNRGVPRTIIILILALLAGVLAATLIPRPVVGLIYLSDAIYDFTAREMIAQIHYARDQAEIRAVVIVMDSPGGTVVDTEAVYLELALLRQAKPVITMVQGMSASGGYYLAAGTDFIVAGPGSPVGNVGVISQLPPSPAVFEDIASTGPYKLSGTPRDSRLRRMEAIRQAFQQAVVLGRGEALAIEIEELVSGEIWMGNEARQKGLIDELGSISTAVERAAQLAQINNYATADLRQLAGLPPSTSIPFFLETELGMQTPYPREIGLYLLYIPPDEVASE
jgi:protease-4